MSEATLLPRARCLVQSFEWEAAARTTFPLESHTTIKPLKEQPSG